MKAVTLVGFVAYAASAVSSPIISGRQSTTDQLFEALGPLGEFVNGVNNCTPVDVGVGAVEPNGSIATINLDIDQNDVRVNGILKCISNAVPVPVSSRPTTKRSPGLDIDLGVAL
ncbi:hypothetical protein M409DRAFT_25988 [Zasmidium cellare ATCC 36951]|uniref:Hydrophobin n=1 Tax=Zasmidium cellare ATCC 36951 TaxID=1080233 RepID=A0A6A6C9E8_ZASCE|nr:uncharacterized protein M409DRAFT_25988 [Zasmidium cellare ATCC 36951]KAF2163807.1 hypothetical protein M409DRAFT_25988 [Zasmidium cellare ATCC 36951]